MIQELPDQELDDPDKYPAYGQIHLDLLLLICYSQVNWPYKGAYILRKHGRPKEGRHALQVWMCLGMMYF